MCGVELGGRHAETGEEQRQETQGQGRSLASLLLTCARVMAMLFDRLPSRSATVAFFWPARWFGLLLALVLVGFAAKRDSSCCNSSLCSSQDVAVAHTVFSTRS